MSSLRETYVTSACLKDAKPLRAQHTNNTANVEWYHPLPSNDHEIPYGLCMFPIQDVRTESIIGKAFRRIYQCIFRKLKV